MPPVGYKRLSDAQVLALVRGRLAGRSDNAQAVEQKIDRSSVGRVLRSERAKPFFAAERKRQRDRQRAERSRLEAAQRRAEAAAPPKRRGRTPFERWLDSHDDKPTPAQFAECQRQERAEHDMQLDRVGLVRWPDGTIHPKAEPQPERARLEPESLPGRRDQVEPETGKPIAAPTPAGVARRRRRLAGQEASQQAEDDALAAKPIKMEDGSWMSLQHFPDGVLYPLPCHPDGRLLSATEISERKNATQPAPR